MPLFSRRPRRTEEVVPPPDGFLDVPAGSAYVIRHELFHHVQHQYTCPGWWQRIAAEHAGISDSTTAWWMEAIAEWGAHQAQERAAASGLDSAHSAPFTSARGDGAYSRHLSDFLDGVSAGLTRFVPPTEGVGDQPQYGAFLFAEYLEQQLGTDVIRQTWQAVGTDSPPITAISQVVSSHGQGLGDLIAGFHRADLTLIDSYTDSQAPIWSDQLSDGRLAAIGADVSPSSRAAGSGSVHAGGALYLEAEHVPVDPEFGAAVVTVSLVASGDEASTMQARAVRLDDDGSACTTTEGEGFALTGVGGRLTGLVPVTAGCDTVVVVVTNSDPTAGRDGQSTGAFEVSYDMRYRYAGDGPVDLGLVLDLSPDPTTEAVMIARQRAAAHAVVNGLRPGDRVALAAYDSRGRSILPLTEDTAVVHAAIDEAYDNMWGWSYPQMGDGIGSVVNELSDPSSLSPARARVVVAFGDGGGWSYPVTGTTATMGRLGIPAFVTGWEPLYLGFQITEIAESSGGFALDVAPGQTPDDALATLITWRRWTTPA